MGFSGFLEARIRGEISFLIFGPSTRLRLNGRTLEGRNSLIRRETTVHQESSVQLITLADVKKRTLGRIWKETCGCLAVTATRQAQQRQAS
jgi:hypothetical protein